MATNPEPTFAAPTRPTADERKAWEDWRDAEQEARDTLQKQREAADGTPRPEPTRDNHSRSPEEETAKSARSAFSDVATSHG